MGVRLLRDAPHVRLKPTVCAGVPCLTTELLARIGIAAASSRWSGGRLVAAPQEVSDAEALRVGEQGAGSVAEWV